MHLERGTDGSSDPYVPADGIILSGTATDGAFSEAFEGISSRKSAKGPRNACNRFLHIIPQTNPSARAACRNRRQDGALRRLRHAGAIRHRGLEGTSPYPRG